MSWICDECSSNNDDDAGECFVCGAPRSRASVREAARRRRQETSDAVGSVLCSRVFPVLGIAAVSAAALLVIGLIVCVITGRTVLSEERVTAYGQQVFDRMTATTAALRQAFAHEDWSQPPKETPETFGERADAHLRRIFSPPKDKGECDTPSSAMRTAAAARIGGIRRFFLSLSGRTKASFRGLHEAEDRLKSAVRLHAGQWREAVREVVSRFRSRLRRGEDPAAVIFKSPVLRRRPCRYCCSG